jgi:uncharacterized membrane protein YeaQ/YmgE (transglycosylase-associated protein family)
VDILVFVLFVLVGGLIVGLIARLAVPGPDPMSIWRTIALGILGSLVGGVIAGLVGMGNGGGLLFALIGAVLLLILYRRIFQKRGITGPSARRL